ncbi:TonB-dependent receptor [Sulfidibacter corallicola]|uniref:TonB-dependent receptor n=1 Tax=Sulfidibacter corallicola TaxID=2818388 RepID=A0A8A4TM60_SULCO|nr:TonB-dependent receptor [Sulfidibacter corallicola]QTD50650.1 TonB-dependent receptor [Sulfidibacter corallicola]
MRFHYFVLILICWMGAGLLAQTETKKNAEAPDAEPTIEENIQVWATEVRSSSVKLDDEAMAIKQPDHISDLLRTIPGIDVGGAHSLNQRITIRSLGDRDLRISIDGASQNSYMYHHMGNLQIHADILKSVDIEVGTGSVINGGLGGSVRMETKDPKDLLAPGQKSGARLQASYGDNASTGYTATGFARLNDRIDVLAYYNFVDRDNFSVGGDQIKDFSGNEIPGTDGEVRGLEGELGDALFKLGWDLGGDQRLEMGYENYKDEGDYSYRPDMGLATDLAIAENLGLPLVYPTEFTRDTLTLNYEVVVGSGTRLEATAYQNTSELFRDESGVAAVFGGESLIEGEAENFGFEFTGRTVIESGVNHTLTYGVNRNQYDTAFTTDSVEASSEDAVNTAVFIEDRIEWEGGLALVPGVRFDHVDVDSAVVSDTFSGASAGLAFEHQVNDHVFWRIGSTQLYKAPEIGEVFVGAGLYDSPNPGIEEETGLNTEIGFVYNAPLFGAERFSLGLTMFRTDIDDYIYDYAPNPEVRYWRDNVGDMQIDGGEAYVGYEAGGLRAFLTYATADSELSALDIYGDLDGARLDRTQGDTFSLVIDYQLPQTRLHLHWDSLVAGDVDAGLDLDGATRDNAKDSFSVHNVSARWMPRRLEGLSLTLGVDNLFDEFYASHSSRTGLSFHPRFGELYLLDYEPGRNIKATLAFQF